MRWPVQGQTPRSVRGFGDPRPARWEALGLAHPDRHHAGVDIAARAGSVIVAVEPGKLARAQRWTDGTKAVLLWADSGRSYLYGPIVPNSWQAYGVQLGSRVHEGRPLGRIAPYPGGDEMLHFEVYSRHVPENLQWAWGSPQPSALMNPAPLLATATGGPTNTTPTAPGDTGDLGWLVAALLALAWR